MYREREGKLTGAGADDNYKKSADYAYEIICEQILSGDLIPGQKLSLRNMSRLTGASNIPVMQAFHRLESEGLLQTIPYVGSRIIEFTEDVIKDRYALRLAVECQVARILSRHMTNKLYQELLETAASIDAVDIAAIGADRQFWDRHAEFHMSLARATGYKSLVDSLYGISLFNLVRRADSRAIAHEVRIPGDNHAQLVEAIHSGDPDQAETAARVHINRSEIVNSEDL